MGSAILPVAARAKAPAQGMAVFVHFSAALPCVLRPRFRAKHLDNRRAVEQPHKKAAWRVTRPRLGSAQRDDPPELARSTLNVTDGLLEGGRDD